MPCGKWQWSHMLCSYKCVLAWFWFSFSTSVYYQNINWLTSWYGVYILFLLVWHQGYSTHLYCKTISCLGLLFCCKTLLCPILISLAVDLSWSWNILNFLILLLPLPCMSVGTALLGLKTSHWILEKSFKNTPPSLSQQTVKAFSLSTKDSCRFQSCLKVMIDSPSMS